MHYLLTLSVNTPYNDDEKKKYGGLFVNGY